MACNVCGNELDVCENCITEIEGDFYCFDNELHFCSANCWEAWQLEDERKKLKEAIDDEK